MGDDEARARAALADMQSRINAGPRTTLGVGQAASTEEVRAAFLALTKRFHPARFGRMSPDIQRLSNEIFLAIKSAHDTLLRGSRSGAMPVITDEGSAAYRGASATRTTATMPVLTRPAATRPPSTGATPASSPTPATYRGPAIAPPAAPSAQRSTPAQQTGPVVGRTPTPRGAPRRMTPPSGTPAATRPTTPAGGMPAISRSATPPSDTPTQRFGSAPRPGTPPAVPRAATSRPATARRPSTPPAEARSSPARPPEPPFDEQAALQHARDLLATRNWPGARQALQALAARVPQSRHYRALLCYARGREAQAGGRVDEAALEFQRALQLEPDLGLARQALGELPRRR